MRPSTFSLRKPVFFPLRVLAHTYAHCLNHHVFTRASAMTYTSLLAIVPTLILIHAIAGTFGILDLAYDVFPLLNQNLQLGLPVTDLKPILGHAESIGFAQLGIIGSIGLFVTFVLAMENLETNMNVVWHVKNDRGYLNKILVAIPFLLFVGALLGGIAGVLSYLHYWMQMLRAEGISVLPNAYWKWLGSWVLFISFHIVSWFALFLLYQLVPHTRVHVRAAMASALLSLVAMRILVWGFMHLQIYFFHRMSLFYGSLAFIPLVMLLVYGLWCVALFGNAFCWRVQNWPPRKSSRRLTDKL